jgi:hypothetical protein
MIEEILGLDKNNIQPYHDRVMQELIDYNCDVEYNLQLFTECDDINGIIKPVFIFEEQERLYTILGTTSALLFLYNKLEQYELSHELHTEMKKSFTLIMDEIFPDTNNEDKFYHLVDSMFDTFKKILQ